MIKILHTGDIHLDSAFSNLTQKHSEVRRNELRAAFTSMMTYARMNNTDIILIAGDVFDGDFVTRETLSLLIREFKNFGKPVFISPGNHDCVTEKSIWLKNIFPDNVHVFTKPTVESVELENPSVTVYGYAFTEINMTESPLRGICVDSENSDRINLLVGHCELVEEGGYSTDCPVTAAELQKFGADYAALAHIHNNPPADSEGHWCYSGCLEPRSFRETGAKGACMVEIEKKNGKSSIAIKRVRFAKRRYECGELILNGQSTQEEIAIKIAEYIHKQHFGEDVLLSLKLAGYVAPSLIIDTEALEENCNELFMLKLTDSTRPDIDISSLEKDLSLKGEVYRKLKSSIESNDERTREVAFRALRYAIAALCGDNAF